MPRRIAVVVALSLTVVLGVILFTIGPGAFRTGASEDRDRDIPVTVPVADSPSGLEGVSPFDDDRYGHDDDEAEWEEHDESPYSEEPYSGGRDDE